MPDQYQTAPDVVDVDFHRAAADKLYRTGGIARGINPARIDRIHEEIRFDDLVADLTGKMGDKISCPFHGTDRTPSFTFYRGGNDAFCFGCGIGGYYEHIKFVQKELGISWVQALRWIEKHYELPALPDVVEEVEEDDEITTEVYLPDLQETYFVRALREYGETQDDGLFEEYALIYFSALELEDGAREAKKQREHTEAERMRTLAAKKLARVLGQQVVNDILDEKEGERLG